MQNQLIANHREIQARLRHTPWIKLPATLERETAEAETAALVEGLKNRVGNDSIEIASLCPDALQLLARVLSLDDPSRIRVLVVNPGEVVDLESSLPNDFPRLEVAMTLNFPEDCEFWCDLAPDGSKNRFSTLVPLNTGSTFLLETTTRHRLFNRSAKPCVMLVTDGALRFTPSEIVSLAKAQSPLRDYRATANALVAKAAMLGKSVPPGSETYLDASRAGFTSDLVHESIAVAVVSRWPSDQLIRDEALHLITSASFFPNRREVMSLSEIEEWLVKSAKEGKEFAAVLMAGLYVKSSPKFAIELMRAVASMEGAQSSIMVRRGQLALVNLKKWKGAPGEFNSQLESGRNAAEIPASLGEWIDFADFRERNAPELERVRRSIDATLKSTLEHVYAFNTEPLAVRPFSYVPKLVISPCSGLKPFALFKQFHWSTRQEHSARFVLIDHGKKALAHFERLLAANDYEQVLAALEEVFRAQGTNSKSARDQVSSHMRLALDEAFDGDPEVFMECLRGVAGCATLQEADFFISHDRITDLIGAAETALFWHSNAWTSNAAMYRLSPEGLRANYRELVMKIGKRRGLKAWMHYGAYDALLGETFEAPKVALTSGGIHGKPSLEVYLPL